MNDAIWKIVLCAGALFAAAAMIRWGDGSGARVFVMLAVVFGMLVFFRGMR